MTDNRAAPAQSTVSEFLTKLLSINSPELGARLKQRLNSAFIASGLGYFDEKSLGFGKFTDYLERLHGDLVIVERKEGVGDILVSLRPIPSRKPFAATPSAHSKPHLTPVIRNDVWQAFANPDSERKRFLNKETGKVVHFLAGKPSQERTEVETSDQFYEIPHIGAAAQIDWMKEFLGGISCPSNERQVLEGLITKPYSSAVNVTFTRALDINGPAWRRLRAERIATIIHQWATEKQISSEKIHVIPVPTVSPANLPLTEAPASASNFAAGANSTSEQMPPRQQVSKLLELLSDEDITRLVIPTLLSTILIKSRM